MVQLASLQPSVTSKFKLLVRFRGGWLCVTMPNFVTIGRTMVEIWPFFDFSRWQPYAILYMLYFYLEPSAESSWWSLLLCKIWLESAV